MRLRTRTAPLLQIEPHRGPGMEALAPTSLQVCLTPFVLRSAYHSGLFQQAEQYILRGPFSHSDLG